MRRGSEDFVGWHSNSVPERVKHFLSRQDAYVMREVVAVSLVGRHVKVFPCIWGGGGGGGGRRMAHWSDPAVTKALLHLVIAGGRGILGRERGGGR